jgi:hypothetical protein
MRERVGRCVYLGSLSDTRNPFDKRLGAALAGPGGDDRW